MTVFEPIAIVGSGCRFPGKCSSPARLWDLLQNPRNVASNIPKDRFSIDSLYDPNGNHHGAMNMRESYFLDEDVRCFDAPFFNISAAEAESMDPQQRLLLETVYESLEAAGQTLQSLQGSDTGVFCGMMCHDYENMKYGDLDTIPRYTATGTASSIASNRASYFFDWHGPSMTIDTACSSSLVAVHLAAKALRDGDCRVAVAAGTNLLLAPNIYVSESKLNMLSPTGRSRMWDVDADGYARGDGVAAVVLKRLSDALADGDFVESIIRATDINQDGRSPGITMPSTTAQARLIRSTYKKAGLNPENPMDRCQYFEAHGTGTQAGDPREAAAIYEAFFANASENDPEMLVGSIKTIIGHTESTAGIAGLLKASLSLQHGMITPNLHFRTLNPSIQPYTSHLSISTQSRKWPDLPPGVPRRVSVNSFGFGGTNAHILLESHENDFHKHSPRPIPVILPFVFSASSERSLGSVLERHLHFLDSEQKVDLNDLAWSLLCRRTDFDYRVVISAASIESLKSQIIKELDERQRGTASTIVSRPGVGKSKRLLGVFTGQGAQWPQMGLDLVSSSSDAKAWMDDLQASLDDLPSAYQPDFSLKKELSALKDTSRIYQAALSQPLCTALQIILIKFLKSLGITFDAVIGHSSGEIAAAYAAGILSATDAIRIAHLRGHFAALAGVPGKTGAMLAAGMSMHEAQEFCDKPEYRDRIRVAACNSPSSVTLSGDVDAIQEIESLLKKESKFARTLQVDTAYHSHHMAPCSEPYLRALKACNVQPCAPTSCRWFSSVYNGNEITGEHIDSLKAQYWVDNMGETVLFSQAFAAASSTGAFQMMLEIGPHPALKGPAMQTLAVTGDQNSQAPYFGLLNRGKEGIDTVAVTIGMIWTCLGICSSGIQSYVQLFDRKRKLNFVKSLPTYPFDHSHTYWSESRVSRSFIHNQNLQRNPLLGKLTPDTTESEWRWRNYLRCEEIPWLNDHCIQSQPVFPAAGYLAMAVEAATTVSADQEVCIIEVEDLVIHQAIQISEHHAGTETLFTLSKIQTQGAITSAKFACHSDIAGTLRRCASGRLSFNQTVSTSTLPNRAKNTSGMSDYRTDIFYSALDNLGYGYSGAFRCIESIVTKSKASSGLVHSPFRGDSEFTCLVPPALIDSAIQAVMACSDSSGNNGLGTLYIPTGIRSVTIDLRSGALSQKEALSFDASIVQSSPSGICGDSDLFDRYGRGFMQFEGIQLSPLMTPAAMEDRAVFSQMTWGPLEPVATFSFESMARKYDLNHTEAYSRIALFYLRKVADQVTTSDRAAFDWHRSSFMAWIDQVLSQAKTNEHPEAKKLWLEDGVSEIDDLLTTIGKTADAEAIQAVGDGLVDFFRRDKTLTGILEERCLLSDFYAHSIDFNLFYLHTADIVSQIAFRFPRMRILEIGDRMGIMAQTVLHRLGESFCSFTITEAESKSPAKTQSTLTEYGDRVLYRNLDIDQDPMEQEFKEHDYDLVIVPNLQSLIKSLPQAMKNMRRLVKPGGYLLASDCRNLNSIGSSMVLGCDESFWYPIMDSEDWNSALGQSGFSRIDGHTLGGSEPTSPFSVFLSQAIDDTIMSLRNPLSPPATSPPHPGDLVLIGGFNTPTSSLRRDIQQLLSPYFYKVTSFPSLAKLELPRSDQAPHLLIMAELDEPWMQDFDEHCLSSLQRVFHAADNLLWISTFPEGQNSASSLCGKTLRCLSYENPECHYQHLHVDDPSELNAELLATTVLRLINSPFPNDYKMSSLLWSNEPEIRFQNGKMMIPRVQNQHPMNKRLMAHRKLLYSQIDHRRSKVEHLYVDDSAELIIAKAEPEEASNIHIRVDYSTSKAVRVADLGLLYVLIGHQVDTGVQLVALSKRNASIVSIPPTWVYPCDLKNTELSHYLSSICSSLLANYLVGRAKPGTSILVHEPSEMLRVAICNKASKMGVLPFFSTIDDSEGTENTIYIHERSSIRAIRELLPSDLSLITQLDCSSKSFSRRLRQAIPDNAIYEEQCNLYSCSSSLWKGSDPGKSLENAAMLCSQLAITEESARTVPIQELAGNSAEMQAPLCIVDWTVAVPVSVKIRPASSQVVLPPNKTYLVCGMTGGLAQSICECMVAWGARFIVLAGRSHLIEQEWLGDMANLGIRMINMSTFPMDGEAIMTLQQKVREQLPPVGGIISSLPALPEKHFADISIKEIQTSLEPTLRGISQLDEAYSSNELQFFMLFGPSAGVTGREGMSLHAIASGFISDVIHRRRERGLCGSTISAGETIQSAGRPREGEGRYPLYAPETISTLQISEQELHELIAEGIFAGRQDEYSASNIIAGLGNADPRDQPSGRWHQDPRLWHLIDNPRAKLPSAATDSPESKEKHLGSASNLVEAKTIIENKLIGEIRRILHLSADELVSCDSVLVELGIDSLVAVDLRAWFAKEFLVEIAVLKILGGLSIGDLVAHIATTSSLLDKFRGAERFEAVAKDNAEVKPTSTLAATPATTPGYTPGITPSLTPEDLSTKSDTDNTSVSSGKSYSKDEFQRIERLSYAQSRYWFLNQYLHDQTAYNVTIRLRIRTPLCVKDLEAAVDNVGMRHENLRTCYLAEMDQNNDPSQAIMSHSRYHLEKAFVESEKQVREEYLKVRDHVYNLEEGEVARIRLVTVTSSNIHFLIMGWHHIAMDGASFHILLRDLGLLYTKQPLPPVSRQYTDFAVSQRTAYERGEWDDQLAYWKEQFKTFPEAIPLLPMAKIRSRPVLKQYEMEEVRGDVSGSTMRRIRAFCQKNRCSPFHFFVAVLRIYLVRLTEVEDLCIGIADANRFDPANESTVGFLLNLLPLRFQSTNTKSHLKDILVETKDKVYGALQNSSLPFDKLLDDLGAPRSTAYSPLFQVLVDWQPQTGDDYKLGNLQMTNEEMLPGKTAYDLTLFIAQAADGGAIITFRLQSSLYDSDAARLVARSFLSLVSAFANDVDQAVEGIPLYGPVQREEVHLGKGPCLSSKWPLTISRRIDEVALQHSGKIAIKDTEGKLLTYREMADRSNTIASIFLALKLPAGSPICLFLHPTADWIPCMLAIWKLNLVYVPLDLRNPVQRLATMVQDCQPRVIVCSNDTHANVKGLGYADAHVINISNSPSAHYSPVIENMSEPEARAVILYTSGTTGRPKGIQLRHSSLMNEIEGYTSRWGLGAETVLQQGAMTFNHSLDQMLTGLSNGGRVIVVARSLRGDPISLSKLIADENVTYTKATPSEYANWLHYGAESLRRASSWKFAFGGGEHLTTTLAQSFRALELPNLRLFNSYGPGEITISCHKMEIDYKNEKTTPGNIYPVGYSLPNYSTYIVDKEMRCVPPGVSGEILIGGAGPCMGYLNMEALNGEKFIENPFAPPEYVSKDWIKAYRTFDRGYLLPGGELVIDGRLDGDTQVKIRGIRMELEDIENTLVDTSHGALNRAVVSIRGKETQLLVAFVVLAPSFEGDVDTMLTQLRKDLPLPQYMCPAAIVPVEKLALNVHGKVDRRAVDALPLPKAAKSTNSSQEVGRLSVTEKLLRDIWGKVLHEGVVDISSIPSDTDFFVVGGSSVLLVKLQAMIHEELQVTLPLMDLFEHSVLSAMAQKLEAAQPTAVIDWEAETSLPDILIQRKGTVQSPLVKRENLVVILTGVTGFLGKAVLHQLISHPAIAHVHAIAVRPRNLSTRTLPSPSPNLTLHEGDLSSPLLGLDKEKFHLFAETADLIIHSGANRSFWDAYPVVREANVSSTKILLEFASHRRIPIHFLSSGGVGSVEVEPPSNGQQGYVASKWASERLLDRATQQYIFSAVAHRPNQGHDLPGPTEEWREEVRALVRRMRCIPTECHWDGYMDLVPVKTLAEDMVSNILSANPDSHLQITNYFPTMRVATTDFLSAVIDEDESFAGFDRLNLMKWMGRAKREFGFKWFVTAQNAVVGDKEMGMVTQL